jgi:LPS export ABC transporter protein LptC
MKPQEQDFITRTINSFLRRISPFLLMELAIVALLCSCNNDLEQINAITSDLNLPNQSGRNIEVQYTDSSRLLLIFKTPLMRRYTKREGGPYYEFPEGIDVLFYDKQEKPESKVTAKYAIYHEDQKLWEARDSVVAFNLKTLEQLHTEQLFWDMEKKEIYTHVFTKINTTDGVFYGEEGFESNQDFTRYILKGSSGTVNVKDEEPK